MENKEPEKSASEGKQNDASSAKKEKDEDDDRKTSLEDNVDEKGETEKPSDEILQGLEEEAPPEIQDSLESLSEELDQFLSSLSAEKIKTDGNRDDAGNENNDNYLQIPQLVGKFLDLVEEKIESYESNESKRKWCRNPDEDPLFFESIHRVSNLMSLLMGTKSCLDHHVLLINHAGAIQQRAMAFLEDGFRILLEEFRKKESSLDEHQNKKEDHKKSSSIDQDHDEKDPKAQENLEIADDVVGYPGYEEETVWTMKKIADQLIKGGFGSECREVYSVARRNILMQTLKDQEFEKVSIDEVQKMNWETLEREISIWNKTIKDCSSVYFPGELKLAEQVFPNDNRCLFSVVMRGLAIQFLYFAEALTMTKRSTEKLFKVLDIYETLRNNFPAMEAFFLEEHRNELRNEVTRARCRIGETAISIFSDLENSIKSDSGKTTVPGGAVHPLTRYTMNYLKYTCEYKDTLEQVFKEYSKIERADSREDGLTHSNNNNNYIKGKKEENDENRSPFSSQLMKIMELLDSNLEAKSKLYRDVSLSCIFMMNNGRYIVQKTKGSPEIHQVMGDTWCRRRSSDLRNYHKSYQRETWGKLLGCLAHEGLMHNGKIVKPNLKERFKSFNATFEEIHKTQSTWVVNDEQLQSELRVSVTAVMIPAYRAFLARFGQHLDPGRQTEKYVKFQPEDIEYLIDELFDGNASSSTMAKKRT